MLWKWASVSIEAPFWGTWGGRSFTGVFEKRETFLYLLGEFYEEFERYVREGSRNRQLSP